MKYLIIIICLTFLLLPLSSILLNVINDLHILPNSINARRFINENSILCFIASLSIFLYFICKEKYSSLIINLISNTTFGIYLIHDNEIVRNLIWNNIFNCELYYYESPFILLFHAIITVSIVFIVCCIIELLRQLIFKNSFINRYVNNVEFNIKKIIKMCRL